MNKFKNVGTNPRNILSNDETETRIWPAGVVFELTDEDYQKFSNEIDNGCAIKSADRPARAAVVNSNGDVVRPAVPARPGKRKTPWCVRLR